MSTHAYVPKEALYTSFLIIWSILRPFRITEPVVATTTSIGRQRHARRHPMYTPPLIYI